MDTIALRPVAITLAIIGAVMLAATLCYPFGYDQAVFSVGGQMILHGSIPYRDFLDTKQPLIFYLYAAAIGLFGRHEWSVHLFDLFYQLGAAYYFYRILRRGLTIEISLLAVSLTFILYAGSGFWMTCEAESFALLPSLLLVDVTDRALRSDGMGRTVFRLGLIAGVATMLLLLLKFTLVIGALAAIVFVLTRKGNDSKIKWKFSIGLIVSMIALAVVWVLALWRADALHPFLQSLGWLLHYGSIGTQNSLFEEIFLTFPERIIYSTSIALCAFGILGIAVWAKNKSAVSQKQFLTLLLFMGYAQLMGVLVERKIDFPYQYTRALWAFTPFMALGISMALTKILQFWKSSEFPARAFWVVPVLCVLLLSPLTRIFSQTIPWAAISLSGKDASAEVQRHIPDYFASEQQDVAKYLTARMAPSDQFFFWGNDVALYFFANKLPRTICLTATPFRSTATPTEWKTKLLTQLSSAPPRYLIAEFGDAKPYITGSPLDSYRSLMAWNGLESFLATHYALDTAIGHFLIFKRTG